MTAVPFRYPLQPLLRLRESLERQEENRLFAIAADVARLRTQLEQLDEAGLQGRRTDLHDWEAGSAGALLWFAAMRTTATAEMRKNIEAELAAAEQRRLLQLAAFQAARQKREILEGLRERQQSAYDLASAHREQQALDDVFLQTRTLSSE